MLKSRLFIVVLVIALIEPSFKFIISDFNLLDFIFKFLISVFSLLLIGGITGALIYYLTKHVLKDNDIDFNKVQDVDFIYISLFSFGIFNLISFLCLGDSIIWRIIQ